jgi:hypothetical protein
MLFGRTDSNSPVGGHKAGKSSAKEAWGKYPVDEFEDEDVDYRATALDSRKVYAAVLIRRGAQEQGARRSDGQARCDRQQTASGSADLWSTYSADSIAATSRRCQHHVA